MSDAIRSLRSSPGIAAAAILSLALGIGANTAIFSLIDAAMLRSLPVARPAELLQVTLGPKDYLAYSNPLWEQLRDRQDVFSGIFAYGRWAFDLSGGGEVHSVNGYFASGQFFDTLGVRAALGHTLTPADDYRGCAARAVLSYAFWQRQLGGRPDVMGRTLPLNGHPFEIVGVSEPGFTGIDPGSSVDIMVPLCAERVLHGELSLLDSTYIPGWLRVVARPRPGITAAQATARLQTLAPQIYRAAVPAAWGSGDRERFLRRTFATEPAGTGMPFALKSYRQPLFVLMSIVGLVLLIACANVAGLLVARGANRRREIGIRIALGCGRGRLIRQMLSESLLLSGAGAATGILFASWGAKFLTRYLDVFLDLQPDIRVLAFTSGTAILTGIVFGIVPAWKVTRVTPQSALQAGSQGIIEGSRSSFLRSLVPLQIAISMVLVASAGLLLSSFRTLSSLDPGFDRSGVLLVNIDLRNSSTPVKNRGGLYRDMLAKLRAIPGVRYAALSAITPICGCEWSAIPIIDGHRAGSAIFLNRVSDGYFETLGTPLVAGRGFQASDVLASPAVAVINNTMARRIFGDANPIGRQIRLRSGDRIGDPLEIVGIVKDAKYGSLREPVPPTLYMDWGQNPEPSPLATFQLRSTYGAPEALTPGVKAAAAEMDPRISLEFTTLALRVEKSLQREQLMAVLSAIFGTLALALAGIGLYGTMANRVARRRNEIGLRIALGAHPAQVRGRVLAEAARMIFLGLAAGLAATLAVSRFLASFLYGLTPNDPLTLAIACAVLLGAGLLAAYFPAHRASGIDPISALRRD